MYLFCYNSLMLIISSIIGDLFADLPALQFFAIFGKFFLIVIMGYKYFSKADLKEILPVSTVHLRLSVPESSESWINHMNLSKKNLFLWSNRDLFLFNLRCNRYILLYCSMKYHRNWNVEGATVQSRW